MLQTRVDSGLDGVIVADTVMSEVDGEEGRLVVRGHAVEELVETRGYEGVAALLQGGGTTALFRVLDADDPPPGLPTTLHWVDSRQLIPASHSALTILRRST